MADTCLYDLQLFCHKLSILVSEYTGTSLYFEVRGRGGAVNSEGRLDSFQLSVLYMTRLDTFRTALVSCLCTTLMP